MHPEGGYNRRGEASSGRPHPMLVALATIGVLSLATVAAFFLLILWASSGGVEVATIKGGPGIGIVEIEGVITDSEPALKVIRDFRQREDIKAVVVRINSPGGAVGASQEIYSALKALDKKKPVVASMESVAASGGYYVAIGARKIVANPGTITGSIGVIMKVPNIGPLLEKLGVKTQVLKSGAYKDLGSMTRDMTQAEREVVEGVLKDVHQKFMEDVSQARSIPLDRLASLAQGQIFSGREAKEVGLVDELGNFDTAIEMAQRLSHLKGEPRLIYPEKGRLKVLRELLEEEAATTIKNILERVAIDYAS